MQILLDENKKFFKAELHCHSTKSDGRISVEEQKKLFKEQGYSVVAFTDHEHIIDNSYLDDRDFLTITSCEVAIKEFPEQSTLKNRSMRVCHLNFYALDQHNIITPCYNSVYDHFLNDDIRHLVKFEDEYRRVYSGKGISEMIKIAHEKGFLVSYNHPNWSLENAVHYLKYENVDFVEVYNHSCYRSGGESYSINVFDDFLRDGKKVYATMADDSHSLGDMFGGWVMINADALNYNEIMSGLKNGNFYCSHGPEIYSLIRNGNTVKIKCSPALQIALSTKGRRTKAIENTSEAEFELLETDGYFRITVTNEKGRHANTQAYKV